MGEIIDNEDIDKDAVAPDVIEQQFNIKYNLKTEIAVSLKKSYINKIHGNSSLQLAVNQLDNSIEVYQLSNTSLSRMCRLSGHQKTLSDMVFSPKDDHLLYSVGQDGLLKLWDTRTCGSCVQEYKDEEERPYDCMDVSCNGRILCAGSQMVQEDAFLVFWDQRAPTPLGGYWNSHSDDISQVKFHKEKTEILATGSLDDLLNVYNIMEETEDQALMYSLNIENSVEKITWLDDRQLACITQSEELQLWAADTGDLVHTYSREKVARSIKRSKSDDCYLVDTYSSADGAPMLLAGSRGGGGDQLRSVKISNKKLQPCTNFVGNKQIVRCCWYNRDNDILVTAGESGLISVWGQGGGAPTAATSLKSSTIGHTHAGRHKPY